jgi:hypothetical protein
MKQETLEEAMSKDGYHESDYDKIWREGVEFGVKWQAERMYSEKEVKAILFHRETEYLKTKSVLHINEWFNQFKKK